MKLHKHHHATLYYVSVIVDTNGKNCVVANFGFGGDAITREYEIRVLQYERQNEIGGPPGCLQFFLGTTGLVSSFNWRDGDNLIQVTYVYVALKIHFLGAQA